MNSSDTNTGGYRDSELRLYVKGNFLDGLTGAGLPAGVLWTPKRIVSAKEATASELSGLLWLPTEREMFGNRIASVDADETASNQARLEYYAGDARRVKHLGNYRVSYWDASPNTYEEPSFSIVSIDGLKSSVRTGFARGGVAPAFCVK